MPTVHKEAGFRFFFYSNDHEPRHVHVECGGETAKIVLEPTVYVSVDCMKPKNSKQALLIATRLADTFRKAWDDRFK